MVAYQALPGPLAWTELKEIKVLQDSWDQEVCLDQQLPRATADILAVLGQKEMQDRLDVMECRAQKVIQVWPVLVDPESKEKRENAACPGHRAFQD